MIWSEACVGQEFNAGQTKFGPAEQLFHPARIQLLPRPKKWDGGNSFIFFTLKLK